MSDSRENRFNQNGWRTTSSGGRFQGRGRGRPMQLSYTPTTSARVAEPAFRGNMPSMLILNNIGQSRDNHPIDFLHAICEYVGVNFRSTIAPAFWTLPPAFGKYEVESVPPTVAEGTPLTTKQILRLLQYTSPHHNENICRLIHHIILITVYPDSEHSMYVTPLLGVKNEKTTPTVKTE